MQNRRSLPITEKFRWHLYSKPTHCEYPQRHEGEGQHGAHECHGDGHVDVSLQKQRPEVGSRASGAAAQHKQAQSDMETVKFYSNTQILL